MIKCQRNEQGDHLFSRALQINENPLKPIVNFRHTIIFGFPPRPVERLSSYRLTVTD